MPPAPPPSPSERVPSWTPPTSSPFSWRLLAPSEQAAIDALHRRALGGAGPDVVKPEKPDFFARILGGGGWVIGVFDADRLVAYGIVQHALPESDDPRALIGVSPDVLRVKLAGASVDPDLRGQGLQRALIAARVQLARSAFPGHPMVLYSTSAPANFPSWSNLMAEGFMVRAVKLYYGGHPRYVMVHEDGEWQRGAEMTLDPADLDLQRRLLSEGWRGIGASKTDEGPRITYAAITCSAPAAQPSSPAASIPPASQS